MALELPAFAACGLLFHGVDSGMSRALILQSSREQRVTIREALRAINDPAAREAIVVSAEPLAGNPFHLTLRNCGCEAVDVYTCVDDCTQHLVRIDPAFEHTLSWLDLLGYCIGAATDADMDIVIDSMPISDECCLPPLTGDPHKYVVRAKRPLWRARVWMVMDGVAQLSESVVDCPAGIYDTLGVLATAINEDLAKQEGCPYRVRASDDKLEIFAIPARHKLGSRVVLEPMCFGFGLGVGEMVTMSLTPKSKMRFGTPCGHVL